MAATDQKGGMQKLSRVSSVDLRELQFAGRREDGDA